MTRFAPFAALRYHRADSSETDLSDLVAPPYDVLSDAQRAALESRHQANSVRIDYPHGKTDPTAYEGARALLDRWRADETLHLDSAPTLTVYRMTPPGSPRSTTGVLGALGLEEPGTGDILPHEETTAKDKADRLSLIRSTEVNTSPIWVLATTSGLGEACAAVTSAAQPDGRAVDLDGVLHEVWVVSDSQHLSALRAATEGGPVVVADGHHRFETAIAYEQERSGANAILAYVVELSEAELEVRPIHRIVTVPADVDLVDRLATWFDLRESGESSKAPMDGPLLLRGSLSPLALVPKAASFDATVSLDSERVRVALAGIDGAEVAFHHDEVHVAESANGATTFGVLLRPATVAQIRAVADSRSRMPPKTTFFWPKPRTGLLFRPVEPGID